MPPATTASKSCTTPRSALREIIRRWKPAGADGFEGLVAQALAAFTGYTFRLARSGAQFGRDAATPKAPFSIAMEAKRYSDSVPLQELVGKATLAAFDLAEGVDVWVLASTVEVSEPTQRSLGDILDREGISLVTLDWTEAGLPPLAVLLAAVRAEVLAWAVSVLDAAALADFTAGLDDVAADPAFDDHLAELRTQLSPALLGLDAFRAKGGEWCERTFASGKLAQRHLSQFLTPLERPGTTVVRPALRDAISAAIRTAEADRAGDTLVAVLGGEGAGKTWAVANWWLGSNSRPIMLLSVGRIADQLSPADEPLDMLARLAAHQDVRRDDRTVSRWRRRLDRWSRGDRSPGRFVLLLDGLNETSGKHWVAILKTLMPAVHELGGVVVATCREGYWSRDVAPRLPAFVIAASVAIGEYDDGEFADVMGRNGIDPAALSPRLNQFMRNPRICALALTLVPQLTGIQDLGVERLLLEYWRARLRERDDLVGHNDADFRDLLVRHAREYRERPGTDFDRNEWRMRSGATERRDGRELANDLSDIEEGRFFDGSSDTYRFRAETLHFALGLLVADELRAALRATAFDLDETLAGIVDPIRGFDIVADILTAAIAVATLDTGYPDAGIAALATGWLSLQNVGDEAFEGLESYVAVRPDPFLDAWERRDVDQDDGRFLRLLLGAAKRESVARAFDARIDRWLGSWSRRQPDIGVEGDRGRRQAEAEARIDERVAGLTSSERAYLEERCAELPASVGLSSAAALYLHARPQARFARGIVAFALAHTLAGNIHMPLDDLSWAIRLNRLDHADLARAMRDEIAAFAGDDASPQALQAAAVALRILGPLDAEVEAEALSPRPDHAFSDDGRPDPLDPEAKAPKDVAELALRIAGLDHGQTWSGMWTTAEDHDLERSRDMLVRFDPDGIRTVLDGLAASVATRTDMPLRQLGWRMPSLTAVMSEDTVAATLRRIAEIGAEPSLVPDGDDKFVTAMLVESVLPALDADLQLDLLQSLPPDAPYYLRYIGLTKPLTGDRSAERLGAVLTGDPRILERTLLFLAASAIDVTDALRMQVITCLTSGEFEVATAAAEFARGRDDAEIDDVLLGLDPPAHDDRTWRGGVVRSAIASAIGRRGRADLIEKVPVEHLDWVAARMPAARARLADTIEVIVDRFARPLSSDDPPDAILVLAVDEDPATTWTDVLDRGRKKPKDLDATLDAISEEMGDASDDKFARRQLLLNDQLDRFLTSLVSEGALALARRPYSVGLTELAEADPDRYAGWLRVIRRTEDQRSLRQLQNLGFALAQHYAGIDPELSAAVFAHLWRVESHVTVQVGPAKHAFRHLALFAAVSSPEIDRLRGKAFLDALDDGKIERLTLAAAAAGADVWLALFLDGLLASDTPADQALALTIASFRPANAHSDELLGRYWGRGFLGGAFRTARMRYLRAGHAAHWFALAAATDDPHGRWRFTELGIAAADRRELLHSARRLDPTFRLLGGDLSPRLNKAAEKASSDAAKTLYGHRRPTSLIQEVME